MAPEPEPSVFLAYVHAGLVRAEFMTSLINATADPATPVAVVRNLYSGPNLSISRNEIARAFMETGLPWLWMLDTDMVFSPRTLPALLAAADERTRPIIGALAFMQSEQANLGTALPTMYEPVEDDEGRILYRNITTWRKGALVRVAATGAACLLIARTALEEMAKLADAHGLWFAEATMGGQQYGEDHSFCLRAAAAGLPIFVHTGVQVGHIKPVIMGDVSP